MEAEQAEASEASSRCHWPHQAHSEDHHHGFPPCGGKAWGKGEHCGLGKGWGKGPLHFLKGLGKGLETVARDLNQKFACSQRADCAAPSPAAPEQTDKIVELLQQLAAMGFSNEELNRELLARHNNNVNRVVDELVGSGRP